MIVAPDALNRLVAHLCESGTGGDMNLLLGLTAWAFHRHNDIELVGHRRFLRAGGFYHAYHGFFGLYGFKGFRYFVRRLSQGYFLRR
jgi:hypothetical protein